MPSAPKRYQPPAAPKKFQPPEPAHRRLYRWKWEKASKRFRRHHPLCERCKSLGLVRAAQAVDHVVPHRGDEVVFWDEPGNWQSLCFHCHNLASFFYDGGLGQPLRKKPNYRKGERDTPELTAFLVSQS